MFSKLIFVSNNPNCETFNPANRKFFEITGDFASTIFYV